MTNKYDESRIAEAIVSVLPAGVARACCAERDSLRYAVERLRHGFDYQEAGMTSSATW